LAIDPSTLDAIWPSLLVFAEIGFALLLAIPASRMEVKEHLDKLYARQRKIRPGHFMIMDFYLNFSSHLLVFSVMYLISIVFVLSATVLDFQNFLYNIGMGMPLKTATFYLILITTILVIITGLRALIDSVWKTLHVSEIPVAKLDNLI
jgi:hypothetical protein